jgi:hypothetical protein
VRLSIAPEFTESIEMVRNSMFVGIDQGACEKAAIHEDWRACGESGSDALA